MSHGDIFLDFEGLQFFPKAQLPKRFKMPNIEKFSGTENLSSHARLVINTLKPMGLIDEFIAQLFPQTLIGNTLDWFLKLEFDKYKNWREIATAFVKQYAYDVHIKATTRELKITKQGANEDLPPSSRWREKVAQEKTPPSKED